MNSNSISKDDIDFLDEEKVLPTIESDSVKSKPSAKIIVHNLLIEEKKIRKLLENNGVSGFSRIFCNQTKRFAILKFNDISSSIAGLKIIRNLEYRGHSLNDSNFYHPKINKKWSNQRDSVSNVLKSPIDTVSPLHQIPYSDQLHTKSQIVYHNLGKARKLVIKELQRLDKSRKRENPEADSSKLPWLKRCHLYKNSEFAGSAPLCEMGKIVPSPLINSYRNKNDFQIGYDRNRIPSVGYSVGNIREVIPAEQQSGQGSEVASSQDQFRRRSVIEPIPLPLPVKCADHPTAHRIAYHMSEFLKGFESLLPWDKCRDIEPISEDSTSIPDDLPAPKKFGFYRFVRVRINSFGHALVVIGINSLPGPEVDKQVHLLRDHFSNLFFPVNLKFEGDYGTPGVPWSNPVVVPILPAPIISFSYQLDTKMNDSISENNYIIPIHQHPGISFNERLMGLKFRISFGSFFQCNTFAAERLFELVAQHSHLNSNSIVLDVCCGTGTIGIICAALGVKSVYGIDIVESAIQDAIFNAKQNDMALKTNWRAGPAEKGLSMMIRDATKSDLDLTEEASSSSVRGKRTRPSRIIAILDPPRAGVHSKVVSAVRKTLEIDEVILIFCNPKVIPSQLWQWTKPQTGSCPGEPFEPVNAIPLDLFPHTEHVETVMLLKRNDVSQKKNEIE